MRRLCLFLALLIAAGIGFGSYRGWLDFSTTGSPRKEEKVKLRVDVDTRKIKEDAAAAQQKTSDVLTRTETDKGQIVRVDEKEARFTLVTADAKELTIYVEPNSMLQLRETEVRLQDLRLGDQVTVVYRVKDGKAIARSVIAERTA